MQVFGFALFLAFKLQHLKKNLVAFKHDLF